MILSIIITVACVNTALGISERDEAAKMLAYTLCRVVILGMNNIDVIGPGSTRTSKSKMMLTQSNIKERIQKEYKRLMETL